MRTYSQDLRDRVLSALERKEGPTAIAARLEVSRDWVRQVRKRYQEEGQRVPWRRGGYRRSRVADWETTLRGWIKEQADLTLAQMCERLAGLGVSIKPSALWHPLNKWGLSFKKNTTRQRTGTRGRATGPA
jgi:transposase